MVGQADQDADGVEERNESDIDDTKVPGTEGAASSPDQWETPEADVRGKVHRIFAKYFGEELAKRLSGSRYLSDVNGRITHALVDGNWEDPKVLEMDKAGFNLIEWQSDAAFLVALSLFPDEFTNEDIQDGIESFMLDGARHVVTAARILEYDVEPFEEI